MLKEFMKKQQIRNLELEEETAIMDFELCQLLFQLIVLKNPPISHL